MLRAPGNARALVLALGLLRGVGAGLDQAFPVVDDGQHAVWSAEVVQFIGTVDADALVEKLESVGDRSWQPLLVASGAGAPAARRALLSIGIGDFKNTSSGPYLELALAFPACQGTRPFRLRCRNFAACQAELPDCTHTYMFRSFVSSAAAVPSVRRSGVDARLAEVFSLKRETFEADAAASAAVVDDDGEAVGGVARRVIQAMVKGPGGEEVIKVAVEVPSALPSAPTRRSGDDEDVPDLDEEDPDDEGRAKAAKDGYQLQPYVGAPGVLDAGVQVRHLCAFPSGVDVRPARLDGSIMGGPFLQDLGFRLEGVLHLPDVSIVRLPPWGHMRSAVSGAHGSSGTSSAPASPSTASRSAEEADTSTSEASRVSGTRRRPAPPPGTSAEDLLWGSYAKEAGAKAHPTRQTRTSRGDATPQESAARASQSSSTSAAAPASNSRSRRASAAQGASAEDALWGSYGAGAAGGKPGATATASSQGPARGGSRDVRRAGSERGAFPWHAAGEL